MFICVATLRNRAGSILRYRILNTDTGSYEDIHTKSIAKRLSTVKIRNLQQLDDKVLCKEGDLGDYPIIYNDGKVKNNIPILISVMGTKAEISNYQCKRITGEISEITAKISTFANAYLDSGTLKLKNTIRNEKKPPQPELNKAAEIDIGSFRVSNYIKNIPVSPDIYKIPSAIYVSNESREKVAKVKGREASKLLETQTNTEPEKRKQDRALEEQKIAKAAEKEEQFELVPDDIFEIVKLDDRVELRSVKDKTLSGTVKVPDGVTHICKNVFKDSQFLEIQLPDSVVYLGEYSFSGTKILELKLPAGVTAIPFSCFNSSLIEKINLENITSIDNLAFTNSRIEEVHLEADIIQLGFESFLGCTNLKTFTHNGTIKKIRNHAFDGCINLTDIDLSSVTTIEQYAFNRTGIKKFVINGEVNYIQTGTFTGAVEEIELLEGMYKISANSVSNVENKPITWTLPRSVKNIEKGAILSTDTVQCWRNTVAASSAILAEAIIAYLDDLDTSMIPKIIKKANVVNADITQILQDTLRSAIDANESAENTEFELDESKLCRIDLPDEIMQLVHNRLFSYGGFATEEEIGNESIKFKCILKHLYSAAKINPLPFSTKIINYSSTFNVKLNKNDVLYDDGTSKVLRISYVDNKYSSILSSFIVAKTKDTLRYIGLDNKYTNIMCENSSLKDMEPLFKILRVGDTIGLNSVISGVKYPEIDYESDKEIEVTRNGIKRKEKLHMNIYQALRYSSVTIKLDNNSIVLFVPSNNKVVKCASLGRTVWLNEKAETYKSLQCTIEKIEEIEGNTIFDYKSTYNSKSYSPLFKKLMSVTNPDEYIESYSHIFKASRSVYKEAGDYIDKFGIKSINQFNLKLISFLTKTPLLEERTGYWLDGSIGKTVVDDIDADIELSDGSSIHQYKTVKKTALRNKLMSSGDRKIYIFDIYDRNKVRYGVYASLYSVKELAESLISVTNRGEADKNKFFTQINKCEYTDIANIVEIASMCREYKLNVCRTISEFIMGVYKPTGVFYIGLKITFGKTYRFIPLIQLGELSVAYELVENSNKYGTSDEAMYYLYSMSLGMIYNYFTEVLGVSDYELARLKFKTDTYRELMRAKSMCINGVSDIAEYNKTGLHEIIKRCLGYTENIDELYTSFEYGDKSDQTTLVITKRKRKSRGAEDSKSDSGISSEDAEITEAEQLANVRALSEKIIMEDIQIEEDYVPDEEDNGDGISLDLGDLGEGLDEDVLNIDDDDFGDI